jgi:hypothetical protein
MPWGLLADLVVLLHLGFVLFVTLGGLLAFRWRRAPWVHLPAALWGIWIELSGGICPLTPLENWLRVKGGASGYSGGFVEHYVVPVLYPAALTRETQYLLAGTVMVANLLVYAALWRHRR